jgi:cell division protease FtsH
MPVVLRVVLFWLLMLVLAVVLWQIASKDKSGAPADSSSSISYSDFMAQVDKNNVSSVRLLESPATAEVEGELREPQGRFRASIPRETIPALTDQLRKQGVLIEVSEQKKTSGLEVIVDLLPFFIILVLWIYMVKRRWVRARQNPSAAPSTPTMPTSRPIG